MFKQFLLKKLVQSQMGRIPEEMRPMIMNLVEKHPELLMKLAEELQDEMKTGKTQEEAFMTVAKRHESELKALKG